MTDALHPSGAESCSRGRRPRFALRRLGEGGSGLSRSTPLTADEAGDNEAGAIGGVATPSHMQALAQVTQGIAPALSDLLTVIRGQAGLLLDRTDCNAATEAPLRQIHAAAETAVSLLRQMQIFSGQQGAHPTSLNLNELLNESTGVLRRLLGPGIAVELSLAPHLPLIAADREMLEQFLLILALNARDALPAGGRLLVQTETVEFRELKGGTRPPSFAKATDGRLDGLVQCAQEKTRPPRDGLGALSLSNGEAAFHPSQLHRYGAVATGVPACGIGHPPGTFVVLTVEDNGRGIAPEILPRIFEPFFTTKAGGRSTGLGLAAAAGIVRQHQGWMTVHSTINGGTRFQAYLPGAGADAAAVSVPGADAGARPGHEAILLVEDDVGVRELMAFTLKEQGYRVLQASSGPDAVEVWQWHGPRIRLLLTDMVLEDGMTGLELAAKLRAENPKLQVICTTGYQREAMKQFPGLEGGYHYLQKPCRPQALLAAVRTVLDGKQP